MGLFEKIGSMFKGRSAESNPAHFYNTADFLPALKREACDSIHEGHVQTSLDEEANFSYENFTTHYVVVKSCPHYYWHRILIKPKDSTKAGCELSAQDVTRLAGYYAEILPVSVEKVTAMIPPPHAVSSAENEVDSTADSNSSAKGKAQVIFNLTPEEHQKYAETKCKVPATKEMRPELWKGIVTNKIAVSNISASEQVRPPVCAKCQESTWKTDSVV